MACGRRRFSERIHAKARREGGCARTSVQDAPRSGIPACYPGAVTKVSSRDARRPSARGAGPLRAEPDIPRKGRRLFQARAEAGFLMRVRVHELNRAPEYCVVKPRRFQRRAARVFADSRHARRTRAMACAQKNSCARKIVCKFSARKRAWPAGLDKNIFRAVGAVVPSTMITRRLNFPQCQSFQGIDVCLAVSAR